LSKKLYDCVICENIYEKWEMSDSFIINGQKCLCDNCQSINKKILNVYFGKRSQKGLIRIATFYKKIGVIK